MQSVNLYSDEFRPEKAWMSSLSLLISIFLLLIVFFFIFMYSTFTLKDLEENIASLEGEREIIARRVENIRDQALATNTDELDQKIKGLREDISSRLIVYDVMKSKKLGNDVGFSDRMKVMSRKEKYRGIQISIKQFYFSKGGEFVEMNGVATHPDHITEWVSRMQSERSYHDAVFGSLTIKNDHSEDGYYSFSFGFQPLVDLPNDF